MSEPLMVLTEADARSVLARAQEELRKLGVEWAPPLDERVYALLLELPPVLGRPCRRRDLAERMNVPDSTLAGALDRLRAAGRALRPMPGVWVAVSCDGEQPGEQPQ